MKYSLMIITLVFFTNFCFGQKLFKAIENQDLAKVQKLIKKGNDINATKENGLTPLYSACGRGYFEIADYLITSGADVNQKLNSSTFKSL